MYKMSVIKVSVILPVYNAENHLRVCIESILNQSYSNIELIIVNDGSVDDSRKIIDEYSELDERIKKFHIDNSGPSFARNLGIDTVTGEFIQFVDADDYVNENMIKELISTVNAQSDIVICGYKSEFSNRVELKILDYDFLDKDYILKKEFLDNFGVLFRDYYINYPWNKLYRTRIIKENNIRFDNSLKWGEDLIFNLEYFKYCNAFSLVKKDLYVYNQNNVSSITSNYNKLFFENQSVMYDKTISFLDSELVYTDRNKEIINSRIADVIIASLINLVHKKAKLSRNEMFYNIDKILKWEMTEKVIPYFKKKNIKKRIMGELIKRRSIVGIFAVLQVWRLKNKMKMVD